MGLGRDPSPGVFQHHPPGVLNTPVPHELSFVVVKNQENPRFFTFGACVTVVTARSPLELIKIQAPGDRVQFFPYDNLGCTFGAAC